MLPMLRTKPMSFAVQPWAAKKAGATGPKAACMPDRKKFSQARARRLRRDDVAEGNLATLICEPASGIGSKMLPPTDWQLMVGCRCRSSAPGHDRDDTLHPIVEAPAIPTSSCADAPAHIEIRHFQTSAYQGSGPYHH